MQKLLTYPRAIPSAVPLVMVQSIQNEPEQDPMEGHSRIKIMKVRGVLWKLHEKEVVNKVTLWKIQWRVVQIFPVEKQVYKGELVILST